MNSTVVEPDTLSEQERIKRICELLCKAVLSAEAGRVVAPPEVEELEVAHELLPRLALAEQPDEARIINYLALVGQASPSAIRATLGLSRWCATNALNRLLSVGRVATCGQTRLLTYRLSPAELAKSELN